VLATYLDTGPWNDTAFRAYYTNGSWTNITLSYLVITDTLGFCQEQTALGDNASYWSWTVWNNETGWALHDAGPDANVSYAYNASLSSNFTFYPGETLWVGLIVYTSDANAPTAFDCQSITLAGSVPPPPPPPIGSNFPWWIIVALIAGAVAVIGVWRWQSGGGSFGRGRYQPSYRETRTRRQRSY
jgi:hypothetical protein